MNSSSNKGAVSRRRIARLLARGLRWTPVVAILLTSQANAQTSVSQMAYRRDDVIPVLLDCEAGCYLELNLVPYIVTPLATVAEGYEPTWSPDATQIAFTDSYNSDIYVISASGGNAVNLTNSGLIPPYPSAFHPAWSPDGAQIAFARSTSTSTEIYVVNSDGSGLRRLTYGIALNVGHPAWSPDSARIAFDCEVENGNWDICTMNRDGSGVVRLTTAPGADSNPVWSPDGNRMAFSSDQFGGGNLLALMNRDGSGVSQIGVGIQGWPSSWSPDGAQIAFTGYGDPRTDLRRRYTRWWWACLPDVPPIRHQHDDTGRRSRHASGRLGR